MANIKAGSDLYPICACENKSGTVGNEIPDLVAGEYVTFYAQKVTYDPKSLDKFRPMAQGNATKNIINKTGFLTLLNKVTVSKNVQPTGTEEMNALMDFLYNHGTKIGSTKLYLFIVNETDDEFVKLSWNRQGVHVNYLYGYPILPKWELERGSIYEIPQLVFQHVPL